MVGRLTTAMLLTVAGVGVGQTVLAAPTDDSTGPSVAWTVTAARGAVEGTRWLLTNGAELYAVEDNTFDVDVEPVDGAIALADEDDAVGVLLITALPPGDWELVLDEVPADVVLPAEPRELTLPDESGELDLGTIVLASAVEETVPEEAVPEETVPEDRVREDTVPEEPVPENETLDEAIPEETLPDGPGPTSRVAAIPNPGSGQAVINVSVAGDRIGTNAVSGLAGVTLQLYDGGSGGPSTPRTEPWATCISDSDGDCSFVVPDTSGNGDNRDERFWVVQSGVPGGWYSNADLDTGGSGTVVNPYEFRTGTQLRANQTYLSTVNFMLGTGSTNQDASGGVWQNSRINPILPGQCGLDVAIVHDLSNSLSATDVAGLKAASSGLVDALTGSPSRVAQFSFSSLAPANTNTNLALTSVSTAAGANTVKASIDALTPGGGTNWDRGIYQVATSGETYDIVIVITDGNPTYYSSPVQGPGNFTRFREVENGIFSANAVKATGARILGFGVGSGVAGSAQNLEAISGTTRFDGNNGVAADYFQEENFAAAAGVLRQLALGSCEGSLSVVKQVVPPNGTIADGVPSGGWEFTAASTTLTVEAPAARTTSGDTGAVNFPLDFPVGVPTGVVTVEETPQPGFTLIPVGGQNAVCTRTDTGGSVPVTDGGANGFTVSASVAFPTSCVVYNQAPTPQADITVSKSWVINDVVYPQGTQPDGFSADLTLTGPDGAGPTAQAFGVTRSGYSQGDSVAIDESTTLDRFLCSLESSAITSTNGSPISGNVATLTQANNTYLITNTVTCDTWLSLAKNVANGDAGPTEWTLEAVAPGGALPGPVGESGSAAVTQIDVTPQVTYQLRESGGPLTYVQDDNRSDLQFNPLSTGSMTCVELNENGGVVPGFSDGLNGGVIVNLGTHVRCTATNRTAELSLIKAVDDTGPSPAVPSDFTLTATPLPPDVPTGLDTVSVTGSIGGEVVAIRPGQNYGLSETGPDGYELTSLDCAIGDDPPIPLAALTLEGGDEATCTFTNTRNSATFALEKSWMNPIDGDQVTLSASTVAGNAIDATAVAPDGADPLLNSMTVYAGETVSFAESFVGGSDAANYSTTWECTDGTTTTSGTGLAGDDWVVGADPVDIACTFTNTRAESEFVLEKTWTNAIEGEVVDLVAAAPSGASIDTTATAPGGAVATNTMTVLSGETVTFGESFSTGDAANYTTTWECTDGTTTTTGSTLTGNTWDVPPGSTSSTCTLTNTRISNTLTLGKIWVDGVDATPGPADAANLTIDGTNDGSETAAVPDGGDGASTDAATATVYAGETVTLSEAFPGTNTASYLPTAFDCDAGTDPDPAWSLGDTSADLSLSATDLANPVRCDFTNSADRGTIVIVKNVEGADGTFSFTGDWSDPDDDGVLDPNPFDIATTAGTGSETFTGVLSGSYTVTESTTAAGFDGTAVTCVETGGDDGSGPIPAGSALPLTGTIDLDAGEVVTCTFTNTERSSIVIVKDAIPDSTDTFGFATTEPPAFDLLPDSFDLVDDGSGNANTFTSVLVPANQSYTVTETPAAGWTLADLTCSSADGTVNGTTATVTPDPGETVTCTYTNGQPVLSVDKATDPTTGALFTDNGDGTYTVDYVVTVTNDGIVAGPYELTDTISPAAGVTIDSVTVGTHTDDGSDAIAANPNFDGANDVNLTLANEQIGPNGAQDVFTYSVTYVVDPLLVSGASVDCGNGETLFGVSNEAELSSGGTADACVELPAINIDKVNGTLVDNQDGTYEMAYSVQVFNVGRASGNYTLEDEITVQAPVTAVVSGPPMYDPGSTDSLTQAFTPGFDAGLAGQPEIVANEPVAGFSTDIFTYTVTFTVPAGDDLAVVDDCASSPGAPVVSNTASVSPTVTDDACVDLPQLDVVKSAGPFVDNGDGTYDVAYSLTVTNSGTASGDYVLDDVITPGAGVSAAVSTPAAYGGESDGTQGTINAGFDGDGSAEIVADESLAAGETESFTYTVTYTVDPTVVQGPVTDTCATTSGEFSVANVATLSTGGTDDACVDLPALQIEKTLAPFVDNGDGTYDVSYTVTATNVGAAAQPDLTVDDTISAGAGVAVAGVAGRTHTDDGSDTIDVNPAFDGSIDSGLSQPGEQLGAGESDVFGYTVTYSVDPTVVSAPVSGDCTTTPGEFSVTNVASLGNGQESDQCVDLPAIGIDKSQGVLVDNQDGTYEMTYTLTVENLGAVLGEFALADEITVEVPVTAAVTGPVEYDASSTDSTAETPNAAFDAGLASPGDTSVASGTTDAGLTDVFTYAVTFTVPAGDGLEALDDCATADGTPVVSNIATVNGAIEDDECIDLPTLDIEKMAEEPTELEDGTYNVTYTLEVSNAGTGPASDYSVTDEIMPATGVTINDVSDPSYDPAGTDGQQGTVNVDFDGTADTTVVTGENLAGGGTETDVFTYTVNYSVDGATFDSSATVCTSTGDGVSVVNLATVSTGAESEACVNLPALDLDGFTEVCVADAPYIEYDIRPIGFDASDPFTATLTFLDLDGDPIDENGDGVADDADKVVVNSPSGTVLYPGASLDPPDWPGWKLENGVWVIDDSDAALRDGLQILVEVNPSAIVAVEYPAEDSGCANPPSIVPPTTTPPTTTPPTTTPPSTTTTSGSIPVTGAGIAATIGLAVVLIGGGLLLFGASRRRRLHS